ncbi:MAG: rod shape-determining protein MreC [Candidatus Nanopelagicales bacterium]
MREATRARAVLGVLLLASITLVLLDVRGSSAIGGVRGLAATVFGPVQTAVAAAAAPFVSVASSVTSFGDVGARSEIAAQDLAAATGSNQTQSDIARSAAQLEAMLKTAGASGFSVIPARVVAYGSAQTFSGTVTIDAGSNDGLSPDMSVLNGNGLVGKIIAVGPTTATVQLVTDDDSVVGARLVNSGDAGALQGTGRPGESILRLLDPTSPVKEGDQLVTFGSPEGKPYVAGLPLGTVIGMRGEPGQADREAIVSPAARMGALDIVGVVMNPARTQSRTPVSPGGSVNPSTPANPTGAAAEPRR